MKSVPCWIASAIWSFLSGLARHGSCRGWLRPVRLDARVISVGNIQAGGAGKTPLVAQIAREALERKLEVCILCRGYGGEWEGRGGIIRPGEKAPPAQVCGDEASLLHELVPSAFIGVGKDRIRQFERVRSQAPKPIELVILDDGFQNWKIRKDLEIVALTSKRRTQTLFRDWPGELRHADLVVWTKGDARPDARGRPAVKIRQVLPPSSFRERIWLVTGVADGRSVRELALASGYRVEKHIPFPDHARYAPEVATRLLVSAKSAGCRLALTGKDWVKWRQFGIASGDVIVLEPELVFEEGRSLWIQTLWGY